MGLLSTAAKAAVASSVHGRVQRRQQERWAAQDAAAAQPAPAVAPEPADDMQKQIELLRQLGELRDNGIIDEAEFEAKKAKILS